MSVSSASRLGISAGMTTDCRPRRWADPMRLAAVLLLVLTACGRSDSLSPETPDAGLAAVDAGLVMPADAGSDAGAADAGRWCAAEAASCLADGWRFDEPGRCCNSRMTCHHVDAGVRGFCAY